MSLYDEYPPERDYDETVVDSAGNKFAVGDRVKVYGFDPENDDPKDFFGTVTHISEIDGDVDDYGRGIMIPPYVHVKMDNGEDEHYVSYSQSYEPFLCEDIDKLTEGG